MSTLGGSKGERNAKPKFAALDINRMYKNSRGESSEPSTQKSQVPRKHGMQVLGKVPSARRPPANLPSLKSETNNPNKNSTPRTENDFTLSAASSVKKTSEPIQAIAAKNCNNNNSNQVVLNGLSHSTSSGSNNNNISVNSSVVSVRVSKEITGGGIKLTSHSSKVTISGVLNNINNGGNSSNNKSWSAITTGVERLSGKSANGPPLYQSPQFQYEFPSLDGTVGGGGGGGGLQSVRKEHHQQYQPTMQQQQLQEYHQTQQQQHYQNHHQRQNQQYQTQNHYIPSRYQRENYRDGNDADGNGSGHEHSHHHHQRYRDNSNRVNEHHLRDSNELSLRSHSGDAPSEKGVRNGVIQDGSSNPQGLGPQQQGSNNTLPSGAPTTLKPILSLLPPFMRGGTVTANGANADQGNSISDHERGAVNVPTANIITPAHQGTSPKSAFQRNTAAKWTAGAKLPDVLATNNGSLIISRKDKDCNDASGALKHRSIIREEDLERLTAIANDDSWTKQDEIDYTKKLSLSDEEPSADNKQLINTKDAAGLSDEFNTVKPNSDPTHDDTQQPLSVRMQNGTARPIGAIAIDATIMERVKQRKEEEERRDNERKEAAQRKLQELELKMHKKSNATGEQLSGDDGEHASITRRSNTIAEYNGSGPSISGGGGSNKPIFSGHFQSNLPPRFQRQKQNSSVIPARSLDKSNSGRVNSGHAGRVSHFNRNGPSTGGYMRNRHDSGDDATIGIRSRMASGDEYSQRSHSHFSHQRKASLSSNDEPLNNKGIDSCTNTASWAEQSDTDIYNAVSKRQRGESVSSTHSHDSVVAQIKILQRPNGKSQPSLSEETEAKTQLKMAIHSASSPLAANQDTPSSCNESDNSQVISKHSVEVEKIDALNAESEQNQHLKAAENAGTTSQLVAETVKNAAKQPSDSEIAAAVQPTIECNSENKQIVGSVASPASNDIGGMNANKPRQTSSRSSGSSGSRLRDVERNLHQRGYANSYRGTRGSNEWGGGRSALSSRRYYSSSNEPQPAYSNDTERSGAENTDDDYNSGGRRSERTSQKERAHKDSIGSANNLTASGGTKSGFTPRGEPSRRGRGGGSALSSMDRGVHSSSYRRSSNTRQYGRPSAFDEPKSVRNGETDKSTKHIPLHKIKENTTNASTDEGSSALAGNIVNDERPNNSVVQQSVASTAATLASGNTSTANSSATVSNAGHTKDANDLTTKRTNNSEPTKQLNILSTCNDNVTKDENKNADSSNSSKLLETESKEPNNLDAFNGINVGGCASVSENDASASSLAQIPGGGSNEPCLSKMSNFLSCGGKESAIPIEKKSSALKIALLDDNLVSNSIGTSNLLVEAGAPVNTIIFENTNYKQQQQKTTASNNANPLAQIQRVTTDTLCGAGTADTAASSLTNSLAQMNFGSSPVRDHLDSKDLKLNSYNFVNVNEKTIDDDINEGNSSSSSSGTKTQSTGGVSTSSASMPAAPASSSSNVGNNHQNATININSTADMNKIIASVKKVWDKPRQVSAAEAQQQQQVACSQQQSQQQQQLHQQQTSGLEVMDNAASMNAASMVAAAVAASQQQHHQTPMPQYAVAAMHMQQQQQMHHQQHHAHSSPGPVTHSYAGHGSPFDSNALEQPFVVSGVDDPIVYTNAQQNAVQHQLKHAVDAVKQQQQQQHVKQIQQHHVNSLGMSPPPSLQQQHHQQQTASQQQQHQLHAGAAQFYQTSAQFGGIPTIPSPPAMVFNSSQMPPPPPPSQGGGLYTSFHSLDHSNRSQPYSATAHSFQGHYGAATANAYNAFAMQTPPPNIPPTAPTPDIYSNLASQLRFGGGPSPFANHNSQQLNNPNAATVALISSQGNSIMSSVNVGKQPPPPSSTQIGAIGTKTGNSGNGPYGAATAQQYMNLYASHPPHTQHPQGGPPPGPPPHQMQSNNFYSNSSGGPNGPAYFGGPPPQSTGAQNYGLAAAGLYGGHTANHQGSSGPQGPPPGPPQSQHTIGNFNTQYMNSHLLTAAAMNQFRSAPAAAYMKGNQNHMQDSWDIQNQVMQQQQNVAAQQRNSVSSGQQNLNSIGRNGNNGPPGSSTQVGGSINSNNIGANNCVPSRYPTPIQRPNYPQQQQQQQQQSQQIQRVQNMRQTAGAGASTSGAGSAVNGGGGGPGANSNSNTGNVNSVTVNSQQGGVNANNGNNLQPGNTSASATSSSGVQLNKPYYANNASNGANRSNH